MALNAKQQAFVREYLVDLNATQAAIRAGYSANSARDIGYENLQRPEIAAAIKTEQDKRAERTRVSQDDVIRGLLDEAKYRGDDSSHSARVQAWTQLGRHLAMFTDKTDVTLWNRLESMTDRELRELEQMSDEDLARRIAAG